MHVQLIVDPSLCAACKSYRSGSLCDALVVLQGCDVRFSAAHLGMEGGHDELGGIVAVVRLPAQHTRHGGAVLRVQGRVNFIKQVEGRRIAALDGKDERQSHERLLPAAQLLHDKILARPERHLCGSLLSYTGSKIVKFRVQRCNTGQLYRTVDVAQGISTS